jgi:hypothetical protein
MARRTCEACKRPCDGALRVQYNIRADHSKSDTRTNYFCGYYCLASWARRR